jgi:hypothetical protein
MHMPFGEERLMKQKNGQQTKMRERPYGWWKVSHASSEMTVWTDRQDKN